MKFLDPDDPFYKHLWRRVVIAAILFGWAVLEAVNQQIVWALLFVVMGIWFTRLFFFRPGDKDPKR